MILALLISFRVSYLDIRDITERKKAEAELEQSYKSIRRLTGRLQNIREEERTHIARKIHDELGQQLTVLKLDISWFSKKIGVGDHTVEQKMKGLREIQLTANPEKEQL